MADVFISYQKRDKALVERVRDGLTAAGLTVWWDDDVTPRENWDRTLEREIAAARFVLVLWTRNSVESDWVRIEANFARNECRPSKLVQARFDHAVLPIAFSLTQYADLNWDTPQDGAGWPKLLEWLGKPAPARPAPAPSPAPPPAPAPAADGLAAIAAGPAGPGAWFFLANGLAILLFGFALVNGVSNFGLMGDDTLPGKGVSDLVEQLILLGYLIALCGFLGLALMKRWGAYVLAGWMPYELILLIGSGYEAGTVLAFAALCGLFLLPPFVAHRRGWLG